MAEGTGGTSDDLLLLTMGLTTDDEDFDKAREQIKQLQNSLRDTEASFSLGDFIPGLNAAVQALRLAVDAWNALEDKAISVATNRNYLPYGISAGEAESINTKISANKTASSVGLTGGSTLAALASIAEEQANIVEQGQDPNQTNWVALHTLGSAMGDSRFTGSNLSHLLTRSTSSEVLKAISDLIANATREAYSRPEGSEERQQLLQYLREVQSSPYVPKGLLEFTSLMTKPENPSWSKSGNPFISLITGTPEDEGKWGSKLEERSSSAVDYQSALGYLKTERQELLNNVGVSLYNFGAETFVLPFQRTLTTLGKALFGKAMATQPFEGAGALDWLIIGNNYNSNILNNKRFRETYMPSVLLDSTGTQFKGDLQARASQAKSYSTKTENLILGELGLYELSKMAQTDFAQQSGMLMQYAEDALVRNVTSDMTYTEGKNKGKKLNARDAKSEAQRILTEEGSVYAAAYAASGFSGVYSELYKNGALLEKEYLDLIEKVFNETKHNELNKFFPDVSSDKEVTAKRTKVGGQQVLRLEITVKDEETGKKKTESVDLTAEQISTLRLNLGGI